ncbi:hypothetical protein, partial [Brevibacillus agri]|uniref:hypothetical protein n=1 Tax=Brevibacillus agri TaxID=51101 RepID=UPI003D233672
AAAWCPSHRPESEFSGKAVREKWVSLTCSFSPLRRFILSRFLHQKILFFERRGFVRGYTLRLNHPLIFQST